MRDLSRRLYLPIFYDLTDRSVLIVGGGEAAGQKVRALAPFGVDVIVISPQFSSTLVGAATTENPVTLVDRCWEPADLDGVSGAPPPGLVLACTNDQRVNDEVVQESRSRGIPVLDASRPALGDFIQPATRKSAGFTLAVSSGGQGPRAAVAVRDALAGAFDAAVAAVSPV